MSWVVPSCFSVPSTRRRSFNDCGSGTSSAVTIHGPVGQLRSRLLPLKYCPPHPLWMSRGDVVQHRVAEDVAAGGRTLDVGSAPADHDGELDLPVELVADRRVDRDITEGFD